MEQLTEPHWHPHLAMRALVTVVDGSRLHDQEWTSQNLYADQLKVAQIVVVSHVDCMSDADQAAFERLEQTYLPYQQQWIKVVKGDLKLANIDLAYVGSPRKIQPLLAIQKQTLVECTHRN